MKYIKDLLQCEGNWSLGRFMLLIMFAVIISSWAGLFAFTTDMITIFSIILAYVFGDKVNVTAKDWIEKKNGASTNNPSIVE